MLANIKSNIEHDKPAVIGTFEGKCADSNVENANGMYLGPELWRNLLESDEYKQALKLGYYIGFLGHPEDPGCMDFKDACIVMKDCRLDQSGDVYGKFDLIDTPVGHIVKTFIDGGVTFGISVRGAGDVDASGQVDPNTFVFRGFDLVTFPAYSDAVPRFTEIAASSDIEMQRKYKSVINVIKQNLTNISSSSTIDQILTQFSPASSIYSELLDRKSNIAASDTADINSEKLEGVMNLYLDQLQISASLRANCDNSRLENQKLKQLLSKASRKLSATKRVMASQFDDMSHEHDSITAKYAAASEANRRLKSSYSKKSAEFERIQASVAQLSKDKSAVESKLSDMKSQLDAMSEANLKYKQKIDASQKLVDSQQSTISTLQSKLRETVTAAKKSAEMVSNVDSNVESLKSQLASAHALLASYQQAYADLYANVLGVQVSNVPVTASTSVEELKTAIRSGTNTANIGARPSVGISEEDGLDIVDEDSSDIDLVTL